MRQKGSMGTGGKLAWSIGLWTYGAGDRTGFIKKVLNAS